MTTDLLPVETGRLRKTGRLLSRLRGTTDYGPGRSGWGFLLPGVLIVALIAYAPFIYTLFLSFTDYDGIGSPSWVGLGNFTNLLASSEFWHSLLNTGMWVVGEIVLAVGGGLLVAVLAYDTKLGSYLLIPMIAPFTLAGAAVGVFWLADFAPGGPANQVLQAFGLPGGDTALLQQWPLNTILMIIAASWQYLGLNALLFVVGLQSIPKPIVEAAKVDGARGWRLFSHIIWPMLRPTRVVVTGLAIIASLKSFDTVYVMTGGGPGRTSETLAVSMYREAFVAGKYGEGSALAVMLCLLVVAVAFTYLIRQFRALNKD